MAAELEAAHASGMPHLWRTEFKTTDLRDLLQEVMNRPPAESPWTANDAPPPRANIVEPARVCLVTCERKGLRYVTKAQYNFSLSRWFFDDPPSGPVKVVAWMDAPPPYLSDVTAARNREVRAESSLAQVA